MCKTPYDKTEGHSKEICYSPPHRDVEEVPDLVGKATPWMVALIVVEAIVNHFHRWRISVGVGGFKVD